MNWVIIFGKKGEEKVNVFIHSSGGYYMPAVSRHCAMASGECKQESGIPASKENTTLYEDLGTLRNTAIPLSR